MDSNFLPVIVVILIAFFLFANTNCTGMKQVRPIEKTPVTFINENPEVTQLGLVRFILNEQGEKVDYVLMNLKWDYHTYVIDLEPGTYGVTQYVPQYDKIIAFQTITVGTEPIIVKFQRLF